MLRWILTCIQVFSSLVIVGLVLLQRGKGAEAGAGFGAGASGTVFGARGASTALSRATAILAAVFMVTSLSLAYVGARKTAVPTSILDQLSQPSGANSAPASTTAAPFSAAAPTAPVTGTAPAANAPSANAPNDGSAGTPAP